MKPELKIDLFYEFIETQMRPILLEAVRQDKQSIAIDFSILSQFNIELAEEILGNPDDMEKAGQLVLDRFDIKKKLEFIYWLMNGGSLWDL